MMTFVEIKELRDHLKSKGLGNLGIEHELGIRLHDFIIKNNIKKVVETGIHHGFSSWYILKGLWNTDGHLWSIECDSSTKIYVQETLWDKWTIIYGVSPEKLIQLYEKVGEIDLFWHDSDHVFGVQFGEFVSSIDHARIIGGHDLYRTGAWIAFLKLFGWKEIWKHWKYALSVRPDFANQVII